MTLEDSMPWPDHQGGHAFRLRVMAPAQEMANVSRACREFGTSRSLFSRQDTGTAYRRRKRYLAYGPDGLHSRRHGPRRGHPATLGLQVALALAWPTWGPARLANQLRRPEPGSLRIAPRTSTACCAG